MNFKKIANRIETLQNQEENKIQQIRSQIDSLKNELDTTVAKMEETFANGDIENGTKLLNERIALNSKIEYLETFLEKREAASSIPESEAREILAEMNDELYKTFTADKKRFEALVKEIVSIVNNGKETMRLAEETGNMIASLQKKGGSIHYVDGRISGFYHSLETFANSYNLQVLPNVETLLKEKQNRN